MKATHAQKLCVAHFDADSGLAEQKGERTVKISAKCIWRSRPILKPPPPSPFDLIGRSRRDTQRERHSLSETVQTSEKHFSRECLPALSFCDGFEQLHFLF